MIQRLAFNSIIPARRIVTIRKATKVRGTLAIAKAWFTFLLKRFVRSAKLQDCFRSFLQELQLLKGIGEDMASQAQIEANRRNAKKSTGPKTLVGKNRSRLNSYKTGTRARIALLPEENPIAFKERMIGWIDRLKPRNSIELFLAERAVYLSWQLDRTAPPVGGAAIQGSHSR